MRLALVVALCVPLVASADDAAPPTPPAPATPPATVTPPATPTPPSEPSPTEASPPSPPPPADAEAAEPPLTPEEITAELEEIAEHDKEQDRRDRIHDETTRQVKDMRWLSRFITVFVDVGAFAVGGNGSGIRSDIGHVYYPKYIDRVAGQWVFMGDPLSTAVNSLGEPSDTSTSREIARDTINSEGRPSLLVNAIGLSIGKDITERVSIAALAQLLPRPGDNILDIQQAELDYRPLSSHEILISAGKIDSVLGIEYREQDAYNRLGVTPSLICRYTCGRPLGVRARFTHGALSTYATITNGDNFQQIFEHDSQLKANRVPTLSGHVQYVLPIAKGVEIGASGAIGPQDNQPDLGVLQWHVGFDAKLLEIRGVRVMAEYIQGRQRGKTESMTLCDAAPCLTYKGAYLLADRRVSWWFHPYARVDWRSAVHTKGAEFVYESHTLRATVGAHFEMTSRIIAKIEYTWNHELGGIPQFPDDILTSSLVVISN